MKTSTPKESHMMVMKITRNVGGPKPEGACWCQDIFDLINFILLKISCSIKSYLILSRRVFSKMTCKDAKGPKI